MTLHSDFDPRRSVLLSTTRGRSLQRVMSHSPKGGPPLRLFLIRHGETVDNVAGLYAGSRNSALTYHGVQQAQCLGRYFVESAVQFHHIFSSDLDRAATTAGYIRNAQVDTFKNRSLKVVEVLELREQDFGSLEGKSFHVRNTDAIKLDNDEGEFQHTETKESLAKRTGKFVEEHLLQAIQDTIDSPNRNIAVVSHGMLLAALWRCLLRRQAPRTVELDAELLAGRVPISLEHLGGWSNTGYLELEVRKLQSEMASTVFDGKEAIVVADQAPGIDDSIVTSDITGEAKSASINFSLTVKGVNCKNHLRGLKRAINGSSKFDEGQKSIATFFKKQRS